MRIVLDLAIEVLSPDDTVFEIEERIEDYFAAGSRLAWVIDPRTRTVTVYRPEAVPYALTTHETVQGEDVLPGFSCRVAEFFTWLDVRGA